MSEISRRAVMVVLGGGAASVTAISLSRVRGWPGGPPAGPVRTSFGSVAVLGSSRVDAHGSADATHASAQPAAHSVAAGSADAPVGSAVHGAWTAGVLVDVEVHNRLRRPVELSPGQFRVRLDRDGPTVSLYSSDRDAGPLEPGATRTFRISYLAPPPDSPLSLVFDDTGSRRPLELGPVGRPTAQEVSS